ncbi:MAG TPA: hypothetical protein VMO26_17690 [Vicinamibacterales bacterium]|nr:hypothetical protein [Vicinamibacterales bacterium]
MVRTLCSVVLIAVASGHVTALARDLTYSAPPGWKVESTSSSMRVAQFTLPRAAGDAADAELVIYYFGGSGGSVEANIDRWLGQMQQPDGRPSKAVATRETRTANGLSIALVDVSGTYVAEVTPGSVKRHNDPGYRLRAAVVETPGGPYFIKLTGPAKTVAMQTQVFDGFVSSLKYTP